ncbi:hypothetical protein DRO57_04420 [Candidatus Bathyarchaeota archaeon]|nr:MAG: hypothetical protein DRO57_04420 [Candidatus Bathyarchaeota archaeon]
MFPQVWRMNGSPPSMGYFNTPLMPWENIFPNQLWCYKSSPFASERHPSYRLTGYGLYNLGVDDVLVERDQLNTGISEENVL